MCLTTSITVRHRQTHAVDNVLINSADFARIVHVEAVVGTARNATRVDRLFANSDCDEARDLVFEHLRFSSRVVGAAVNVMKMGMV